MSFAVAGCFADMGDEKGSMVLINLICFVVVVHINFVLLCFFIPPITDLKQLTDGWRAKFLSGNRPITPTTTTDGFNSTNS
jgi:hypothetical protein